MKKLVMCCLTAVALVSGSSSVPGAEPESLQALLQQETAGESVNRRDLVGSQPANELLGWHTGMIKMPDGWRAIEELSTELQNDEYEKKRAELSGKPVMHLALARWCARNDLPQRARAHYFGVLMSHPDSAEARKYLGHVPHGSQWVQQDDLEEARKRVLDSLDSLQLWTPKLKEIVAGLHSGKPRNISQALAALDKLDAAQALPALEFFATHIDDDLARPLVRKIAELRSSEACISLVRISLRHPRLALRQQTSEAIRTYPQHYFVPQLLSILSSDVEVANNLVMYPNGHIGLDTVVTRELMDRKQTRRAQKFVSVVAAYSSDRSVSLDATAKGEFSYWSNFWAVPKSAPVEVGELTTSRKLAGASNRESEVYVPRDVALTAAQNVFEQGKQRERAAAQQNRALSGFVNRVCSLLRATTDESIGDDARLWWAWWNDHNERYVGEKPTQYAFQQERAQVAISSETYAHESKLASEYDFGKMLIQYSCLVPGTLVQTSSGLVPIEEVQIGDMVLSQDVETAELTLKPVLLTTIRPPKSTIKIATDGGVIEATGGHLWWVSGKGWLKTRDLKPDMMLHTATGTTKVEKLTLNPTRQQTYNLVVDGFHTYFVGPERVLSYDNTVLRPTLRQLPGYGLLADVTK